MRWLFWLVVLSAAAVVIAIVGRESEGYAMFVWPPYRVELSLVLFAIVLAAAFGALHASLRLLSHTLRLPEYVRGYRARRRRERALDALSTAALSYMEGRYARAEKQAESAFEAGHWPGLAALLAARAAHQLRAHERRDAWLARAGSAGGEAQTARLMTQAESLLDERDFAAARDVLHSLHLSGPRHIASLRLLLRAEHGAKNWDEVLRLAALLAKRGALSPALAGEYRTQATLELLERASGDARSLGERWRRLSAEDRAIPRVAAAAARHALALDAAALSSEIIEKALAKEWDASLIDLYGEAPAGEAVARIERAERWLPEHSDDARLLRALGRLCVGAELWGKAQNYLETSLSFEASRATHLDLARLFERLGKSTDAARHFRLAAELP
jgi:HemY protein